MTFTKEQKIAAAQSRIWLAEMMLEGELEPLKERSWAIELELARIALASLEAEPVAYIIQDADARSRGEKGILRYFANISDEDINEYEITVTPLYTAPPAPVVNGEYSDAYQGAREDLAIWKRRALEAECHVRRLGQINDYLAKEAQGESRMGEPVIREPAPVSVPDALADDIDSDDHPLLWSYYNGRNACRAAMLQGAELVSQRYKLPDGFDFDRFNDVVWLEAVASNPHMQSLTTSTIAMVALELNRKLAAGNSPAIPDGWVMVPVEPTEEMNKAGWTAMNEHDAINPTYRAMLAAAPDFRETPDSSTSNCRENAETSINCPCCGRKPLKNRKCSVAGCEGRHVAHGLCQKHYDIEHKNNLSRRQGIREANKKYRARKSAAPQQEVSNAKE